VTTYPLSKTGARQLATAEQIIERGLGTFIEVGGALALIRDGRLYREQHDTFEAYCRDRWGFTSRRARQLMDAAEIGTIVPVENEGQARALAPLSDDPEAAQRAWDEANVDGPATAAKITDAVQRHTRRTTSTETTETTFDPETGEITTSSGSDQSDATSADAAGPGDDEQEGTPAPSPAPKVAPPETIEERQEREAEEARVDRNVYFGHHLVGLAAILGDGDKPVDDLLAGWVPTECPAWLVEATRYLFTPDGMRDLAAMVEKLAVKWEAAGV
jgi:hypothetical protein